MKTFRNSIISVLILISFSSCIFKNLSIAKNKRIGQPYDPEWIKELQKSEATLKEKWINFVTIDPIFFKEVGLNSSREDLKNLEFMPIINVNIDNGTLQNFNGSLSNKKLIIDKENADYFVCKDGKLIFDIKTKIKNGELILTSSGQASKYISKTISNLNRKDRESIFIIGVDCSKNDKYRKNYCVFFNEEGKLMNINVFGRISSFADELMILKKNINSDVIW